MNDVSLAISRELRAVLPGLDTDYNVIAQAIAERIDHDTTAVIEARETSFQTCLQNVLDFYGDILVAQRAEMKKLQAERTDLILKLAAAKPSKVAS